MFENEFLSVVDFLENGGAVLYWILLLTIAMWALIIERVWYFHGPQHTVVTQTLAHWRARRERRSWYAHRVRDALICEVRLKQSRNLVAIKALVMLCPLLGLLGTITGMIEVFDVVAIAGSGNARALVAGISKATIPTMAGMTAAISGVFASAYLQRKSVREMEGLNDRLTLA
jgi:biopolymer transport protein ExbB